MFRFRCRIKFSLGSCSELCLGLCSRLGLSPCSGPSLDLGLDLNSDLHARFDPCLGQV